MVVLRHLFSKEKIYEQNKLYQTQHYCSCFGIRFYRFSFNRKAEMQTTKPTKTPKKVLDATSEIAGFKNWTKVNKEPEMVDGASAIECVFIIVEDKDEKNPHDDKFINVYVNDIGKEEMTTKKFPKFPVGTVIVKEKCRLIGQLNRRNF